MTTTSSRSTRRGSTWSSTSSPRPSSGRIRDLLLVLSEGFKEPDEGFAADAAAGRIARIVEEGLRELGLPGEAEDLHLSGEPGEVLAKLRRAYHRLFVVPPGCVPPVESVFKEWAGEPGFLGGQRGLIMGPPAADMLARYARAGLSLPPGFGSYPDHLALLLEYAGLLAEGTVAGDLEEFAREHLDGWLDELASQVAERDGGGFYARLASLTAAAGRRLRAQTEGPAQKSHKTPKNKEKGS